MQINNNTSNINNNTAELDTAHNEAVASSREAAPVKNDGVAYPGGSNTFIENYNSVAIEARDVGPSILGALFTVGGLLFEKGLDREALSKGTLAGLSQGGVDPAILQFGIKAIAMLLAEPTLEGFMKTGVKLAQDPAFINVLAKLVDVGLDLAGSASAAIG